MSGIKRKRAPTGGKAKQNKRYYAVEGGYRCVRCDLVFPTRSEIDSHSYRERRENDELTTDDLHRTGRCSKDSRRCRNCHPERELAGSRPGEKYVPVHPSLMSKEKLKEFLTAILSGEGRFRNKFSPPHLAALERINPSKLPERISTKLRGRVLMKPKNEGKQTPYTADPIAVASHAMATCCRGCIERWHAIPNDRPLTEAELALLAGVVHAYLTKLILPAGTVRDWMSELPRATLFEKFYLEGDYELSESEGKWEVKRAGPGYQGERTPFKR